LLEYKPNIIIFSQLIFNHFFIFIFLIGIVLLISMVGSIALTVDFDYKFSKVESRNLNLSSYNFYEKPFSMYSGYNESISFWNRVGKKYPKKILWKL
jgi:hypothetical protein